MALVKCKECGKEISSSVATCPGCGKKKTNPFSVITALLILFLIVRCSMTDPPAKPPDTRTPEQIAAAKAADKADTDRMVAAGMVMQSIKAAMRNPSSVQWSDIRSNDTGSVVCVEYRAQNGFGGMNVEHATYTGKGISTKSKDWNKHCTSELYDMKKAISLVK